MSNALYRGSPLEGFISDVAARSGFHHVLGDYEAARSTGQKHPVVWRHPIDRYILEAGPVTDHQAEVDVFAEVKETIEMIVVAEDYPRVLHVLSEIWRLAFDRPMLERNDIASLGSIEWGKVRRPRTNEPLPKGVPTSSFVLIDLVTITWLAPSQVALFIEPESVSVTGKMYEGETLKDTIEAPIP